MTAPEISDAEWEDVSVHARVVERLTGMEAELMDDSAADAEAGCEIIDVEVESAPVLGPIRTVFRSTPPEPVRDVDGCLSGGLRDDALYRQINDSADETPFLAA